MKEYVKTYIEKAITALKAQSVLNSDIEVDIQVERTRDPQHGDFSSNIAMVLAKPASRAPRQLAEVIVPLFSPDDFIEKVEIAGAGFINFYITSKAKLQVIVDILEQATQFGHTHLGEKKKIHLEFVSANPTGPLHVGHGRGAAYGSSLANLLETADYTVHREYYVNDAGRQMDILAISVWLRYLELWGETFLFPNAAYQGDYIIEIAKLCLAEHDRTFVKAADEVFLDVPENNEEADLIVDTLIRNAKHLLADSYRTIHQLGLNDILQDIQQDLSEFGVNFQEWFSEQQLVDEGIIEQCIERLKTLDHIYEHEGALWFRSTDFGDDKDRVIIRENGQATYFASDIAYLMNKLDRGYEQIIYIFGADHHGYMARLKAAAQLLGYPPETVTIRLVQFAILYRGDEKVQMSTRSGSYVTLRELRNEVGNDATRFFYVMRKADQHMNFDLELAKSQSTDNPVYYIQYAHARICSIMKQYLKTYPDKNWQQGQNTLDLLIEEHETHLVSQLSRYPELIDTASESLEPHMIAHYLRELANGFHTYYNAHKIVVDDEALCHSRMCLIQAIRQVIQNGLAILGVDAPEEM